MTITQFNDMHSGGGRKTPYEHIYIEAPHDDAVDFFKSWFNRDPFYVSCQCCGQDYSIMTHEDLEQATGYERNCKFVKDSSVDGGGYYIEEAKMVFGNRRERQSLNEYLLEDDVAFFELDTVEKELGRVVTL